MYLAAFHSSLYNLCLFVAVVSATLNHGYSVLINMKNDPVLLIDADTCQSTEFTFKHFHLSIGAVVAIPLDIPQEHVNSF